LNDHMRICEANTEYIHELKQEIYELKNTIQTYEDRMKNLEKETKDMMKDLLKHSETIAKQSRYTQNNKINIKQNMEVFNKTDEEIQKLVSEEFSRSI
jgi:predicted  nucleic acid-binding Zn-ribbon protein